MFDGVLFDLDGTLWDATPAMSLVWDEVFSRHPSVARPVPADELRGYMGLLLSDIAARMFPALPVADRLALMDEFAAAEEAYLRQHGGTLYPEVAATLARLARRYRLFLVSNCQDGYIECFYHAHALGRYFTASECAGRTGLPKHGNIRLVAEQYGLQSPVYIGDTGLDRTSAQAAGVPFLHAAYGFGAVEGVPRVQCFAEIPAALIRMSPP